MTNEEAIEELEKVDTLDMPVKLCEAHYMSIKALKTISKYKNAYNKGWDDGAKATYEHLKMCEEEQEPKWIPVSERLPEHYQNILFSTKTNRVFEGRYFKDETEHQWYSFRDECFAWNNVVTAWMPLPEPYKAESEDV